MSIILIIHIIYFQCLVPDRKPKKKSIWGYLQSLNYIKIEKATLPWAKQAIFFISLRYAIHLNCFISSHHSGTRRLLFAAKYNKLENNTVAREHFMYLPQPRNWTDIGILQAKRYLGKKVPITRSSFCIIGIQYIIKVVTYHDIRED